MEKIIQYRVVQKQRDVKLRAQRLSDALSEIRRRRIGKGVLYKIAGGVADNLGHVGDVV